MPRNISFSLTTPQFIAGTKDVTRRLGWTFVKAGTELMAVEQGQGLKAGQTVKRLGMIRTVSVRREPLGLMIRNKWYGKEECRREGFPDWGPERFVEMFVKANHCNVEELITRIEFVKL